MTTVHVILNAHIDPIWLWPWTSGLDALLNTLRSAADLLQANPQAIFTCGEAWKYRQVEGIDPPLFERSASSSPRANGRSSAGGFNPIATGPATGRCASRSSLGRNIFERSM